jgi:hypothetical protein
VLFRELEGESVLLDLESGVYFGLNGVGTRIWGLLGEQGSLRSVYERLLDEYDVAPSRLEWDLLGLATDLCDRGLTIRQVGA